MAAAAFAPFGLIYGSDPTGITGGKKAFNLGL
jgi:hypothetical protein